MMSQVFLDKMNLTAESQIIFVELENVVNFSFSILAFNKRPRNARFADT